MRFLATRLAGLQLVWIAAAVTGCAGPQPTHNLGVAPFRPRDDLLTQIEINADCTGLAQTMTRHAAEVRKLQGDMTKELQKPAPTVARMMARASSAEGLGTEAFDGIKLERAAMLAVDARRTTKGCAAIDIDRPVAKAKR